MTTETSASKLDTEHKTMAASEYRQILDDLSWSQRRAAEMIGVSMRSSSGYANGVAIPRVVAKLLRVINE